MSGSMAPAMPQQQPQQATPTQNLVMLLLGNAVMHFTRLQRAEDVHVEGAWGEIVGVSERRMCEGLIMRGSCDGEWGEWPRG